MLFNSWEFLLFFPIVVLVYFVIPRKIKHVWLLVTSCFFYMCWNPSYIILIMTSVVVTYLSGILLDACNKNRAAGEAPDRRAARQKKWIVAGSFFINLLILAAFKYSDFILSSFNSLLALVHLNPIRTSWSVILPVGISFYTFQALGYTMDVYRGEIQAERNILKYALFVTFFPQLVAGPIERSRNLLKDIHEIPRKKMWSYDRIVSGLILMLYGMFLKLVVTERLSLVVDSIFGSYAQQSATALWTGAVCFSFQIYCDFSSYSTIAIGAAKVMGFTLMENFDTPYFAMSIREFWRRWHISLSTWFRDYLYIPLGGSRCGRFRKHLNLMIVFLVSGLWHGAGWHFIAWGGVNGLYQIIGEVTKEKRRRIKERLHIRPDSRLNRGIQTLVTFILVTFAWILFRADSIRVAFDYMYRMLLETVNGRFFPTGLLLPGMDKVEWGILGLCLIMMLIVGLIRYNKKMQVDRFILKQRLPVRWLILYALLFGLIIFGKYGPEYSQQAFIYFQF